MSLREANGAVIAQVPVLAQQSNVTTTGKLTHPIGGVSCEANTPNPMLASTTAYVAATANLSSVPKATTLP